MGICNTAIYTFLYSYYLQSYIAPFICIRIIWFYIIVDVGENCVDSKRKGLSYMLLKVNWNSAPGSLLTMSILPCIELTSC